MIRLSRSLLLFSFYIFFLLNDEVEGTRADDRTAIIAGFSPLSRTGARKVITGGSEDRYSWSTRYYGGNFTVTGTFTSYHGGGFQIVYSNKSGFAIADPIPYLQPIVSASPSVSTEMIKDVLFPGKFRRPSKAIFHVEDDHKRRRFDMEGNVEDARSEIDFNELKIQNEMNEEVAVIVHTKTPVLVESVPYFWGQESLPVLVDNNCADFSPINSNLDFTICNVTSLKICQRSLGEISVIGRMKHWWAEQLRQPKLGRLRMVYRIEEGLLNTLADVKVTVKTVDGQTVDELAWFCPSFHRCCEWECCTFDEGEFMEYQKPDVKFRADVHLFLILALLSIPIIILACCCAYQPGWYRTANGKNSRSQVAEQQPLAEQSEPQQI